MLCSIVCLARLRVGVLLGSLFVGRGFVDFDV